MTDILLILSSADCNVELQAEFGPIPAAAVPVGGTTLFNLQVSTLKVEKVYVTVADLQNQFLSRTVSDAIISPIKVAKNLSVYEAARAAMIVVNNDMPNDCDYRLHILHGDTLVSKLSHQSCIGVVSADPSFKWRECFDGQSYCGYFTATKREIVRCGFDMENLLSELPYADFNDNWQDYGHSATYWRSRAKYLSTRSFNNLEWTNHNFLVKSGPNEKITGEYNWFNTLPPKLSMYTPRVERNNANSYLIQYTPAPSLAEIWVHGNKDTNWWLEALDKCSQFVHDCYTFPRTNNPDPLFLVKTKNRLDESPYECDLGYLAIDELLSTVKDVNKIIHGDFCLSNILYESRTQSIRLIDPRGLNSFGGRDIDGCQLYDIAKLFHSVKGGYDFIVQGYPIIERPAVTDAVVQLAASFGYTLRSLYLTTGLLFLSMVPIHIKESQVRAQRLHARGIELLKTGFSS